MPEKAYIETLLIDLQSDLDTFNIKRPIASIFIGGGTPSLFSAQSFDYLLNSIQKLIPFESNIEITLEANPGTAEQLKFSDYRKLGINRLSLGIQSFNPNHLKKLGRIHNECDAINAIKMARTAGFDNLNLDIMYGLPNQTPEEAILDLKSAIEFNPEHLSWYQLTIEPNTVFYKSPPPLPSDFKIEKIEQQAYRLLKDNGYQRYEISAFSKNQRPSKHNLNYWTFGDYLGIGAGAHGKITTIENKTMRIQRTQKQRLPRHYLTPPNAERRQVNTINSEDLPFEFMLNVTRLEQPISFSLFEERTSLNIQQIQDTLTQAVSLGLLILNDNLFTVTVKGRQFTNDLQGLFLK